MIMRIVEEQLIKAEVCTSSVSVEKVKIYCVVKCYVCTLHWLDWLGTFTQHQSIYFSSFERMMVNLLDNDLQHYCDVTT